MSLLDPESKNRHVRGLVAAVVLLVFLVDMFVGRGEPRMGLFGPDLTVTALTLVSIAAFLVALYFSRQSPFTVAAYLVSAAAALALYLVTPARPSQIMLFLVVGAASIRCRTRDSAVIMVLTTAGYVTAALATSNGDLDQLWTAVGMIGLYLGAVSGRNRRRTRAIEQQNLVLAERARIAREIHDILAHSLSAQLVHLEGAKLLIGAGRTDEAADRVERARELARGGLTETRRALDTLRGETLDLDEALRELAAAHREATTGACEVTVTGPHRDLPPGAGLALVRTAQEALTNVRKHATGADVTVALTYRETDCELRVTDTGGDGGPMADTGSGYGLVGMRERAELIGGTLTAGPDERGFTVLLRVPT